MKSKMFFNNTKAVGPLEEGGESTARLKSCGFILKSSNLFPHKLRLAPPSNRECSDATSVQSTASYI